MKERELAEDIKQQQYFEAVPAPSPEEDEGTREMGPLYPFLISGGTNTERYLEDSTWVKNLCSDGKLDTAIKRAEDNIKAAEEAGDLGNHSYSYVYKVFK